MIICSNCGKQLENGKKFCNGCGTAVTGGVQQYAQPQQNENSEDKWSVGLNIVSALFGIVGIIAFFIYMKKSPIKAQGALIFGLLGMLINIVLMASIGGDYYSW